MGRLLRLKKRIEDETAARMKRAQEQGFDPEDIWKHATKSEAFEAFDKRYGGTYFTKDGADAVAIFTDESRGEAGEYLIKKGKTFDARWSSMGDAEKDQLRQIINTVVDESDIEDAAQKLGVSIEAADPFEVFTDGEFFWGYGRQKQNAVLEELSKRGYDDVVFPDSLSLGEPGVSRVVFEPSRIRSKDAAFDPAKRDSSNLLAGLGAAGIGTAALVGSEDADAGVGSSIVRAGVGQRISTRVPTSVKSLEDALTDNLIINTDAMRMSPGSFEKNAQIVGDYNTTKTRAKSAEGKIAAFSDETVDNLLWLYNQVRPEVRDVSKQWYVGANKFANDIAGKYGISTEAASGVLASLSPQKDWYQNASLAERVVDITTLARQGNYTRPDSQHAATLKNIYDKPQYKADVDAVLSKPYEALEPEQKAMFVRSYDQAFNDRSYDIISPAGERVRQATVKSGDPATTAWGSNREIAKAIMVLEDPSIENISRMMGGQHKVRNFYNNIVDPYYAQGSPELGDLTSDTHAVAASLLKPLGGSAREVSQNFGSAGASSSDISGAQGTYGLHADAYRRAAKEAGVMPREMQSITWEAVRGLFPASFKTANNVEDINSVWKLYNAGKISKDNARDLILAKAGGMADPDWVVRPDSGIHVPEKAALDKGSVHQPGVPGSGGVDSRGRLIAAGVPAAWLGLGGAGLLGSEDAEAAPFGALAKLKGIPTREAYHGSPHDFDAFSMSKIGTGEGAQAYGHGLYFSSKEDIARHYRDTLQNTQPTYKLDGETVRVSNLNPYEQQVIQAITTPESFGDKAQYLADAAAQGAPDWKIERLSEAWDSLAARGAAKEMPPPGKLYNVEIPNESLMLDWDKPLGQQPKEVIEKLDQMARSVGALQPESLSREELINVLARNDRHGVYKDDDLIAEGLQPLTKDEALQYFDQDMRDWLSVVDLDPRRSGHSLYAQMATALPGGEASVSAALKEAGIPGITYSGDTSGARNFVVFDDQLINLVEKGAIDPKLLAGVGAMGAAGIAGQRMQEELPPLDPIYAEFANRRATKQPLWDQLREEVGVVRRPVTDRFRAGADVAADFVSAMVGPTLSAFPTLVNYMHGHSADEMRERRDALNEIANYQPRTALGQEYSDNAAEATVSALAPLLHVGSKLTQPLHPLIRWAAEKTGEREKVAAEAVMDLLPF